MEKGSKVLKAPYKAIHTNIIANKIVNLEDCQCYL